MPQSVVWATTVLEDEAVFPASNWDDAVQVKCTGTVQITLHLRDYG